MKEDFLQFIWGFKLFDTADLKTVAGERLEIISTGIQNKNSGPDFYNAKIKIGDTVWAGTVEIHCKASEWNSHKHQGDKAYDNVVLHVVEHADAAIQRSTGENIPMMKITYPQCFLQRYEELAASRLPVPCANYIESIDPFRIKFWLTRIATERMEGKTEEIDKLLAALHGDFEAVFYLVLFRYFGFKTNALPFEMLARSLPVNLLRKHHNSLFALEALLFGQAGFLETNEVEDAYCQQLKSEYAFLRSKYELTPMDCSVWKFAKLRPVNFPTVRIAQLAALLNKHQSLWETLLDADGIYKMFNIFDVTASEYWNNHYVFGKESANQPKKLGTNSINILAINVLSLMFFAYSNYKGDERFRDKALHLLESAKAETNTIISDWQKCKIIPRNALESQALLHLRTAYCAQHQCLQCVIGKEIVGNSLKKI
jgi:hypothetical protein